MRTKIDAIRLEPGNALHMLKVDYLCRNLRPEDLYEFSAIGVVPDAAPWIVKQLASVQGDAWLIEFKGKPVFVWGVSQRHSGVYTLWGFGTKDVRRAMPAITRWGRDEWLPGFLAKENVRRIEVRIPISSIHSLKWLQALGMQIETVCPDYSVVGEAFYQLAFLPSRDHSGLKRDFPNVFFERSGSGPAREASTSEDQRGNSAVR